MYHSIHFTRGLASLLVLAAHLIFYLDSRIFNLGLEWDIGTQGVEVFFVISGFVMLESLNKRKNITPKDFIISRIIRIVPGYWLVSLVKLCVAILAPSLILLDFSWINIVKSFFFLFSRNLDGNIETFYGVGWTLNYEMFFYILIFFLLLIEKFSFALLVSVLAICAYLSTFNFGELHDLGVVFSVLLVNFIWGLIISRYKHKYKFNVILNSFLFFISVVAFMANLKMEYLGVQYALLVLTILRFENIFLKHNLGIFKFFGDISFSLYLVHPMVGVASVILLSKLGFVSAGVIFSFSFVFCILCAFLFYKYFESPVTKALKLRFL